MGIRIPKSVVSGVSMAFVTARNVSSLGAFGVPSSRDIELVLEALVEWVSAEGKLTEAGTIDISSWLK